MRCSYFFYTLPCDRTQEQTQSRNSAKIWTVFEYHAKSWSTVFWRTHRGSFSKARARWLYFLNSLYIFVRNDYIFHWQTTPTPPQWNDICSKRMHDDVIKWKHFPSYWPFVRGIHRSPVNSPHKGQWRGALMFSLICVWTNGWVNNREAGDLRGYRAHYDVIVMITLMIHQNIIGIYQNASFK